MIVTRFTPKTYNNIRNWYPQRLGKLLSFFFNLIYKIIDLKIRYFVNMCWFVQMYMAYHEDKPYIVTIRLLWLSFQAFRRGCNFPKQPSFQT